MRDLIDRTELLEWLDRMVGVLAKSDDISPSFLTGYRAAMREVKGAARVKDAEAAE